MMKNKKSLFGRPLDKRISAGHLLFGLGYKDQFDLWCEIISRPAALDSGCYHFLVINGLWKGIIDTKLQKVTVLGAPGGDFTIDYNLLFTHGVPKGLHYGDVITYMNESIRKPEIYLYALDISDKVKKTFSRFGKSCKSAKRAFKKSWQGNCDWDINDEIPF